MKKFFLFVLLTILAVTPAIVMADDQLFIGYACNNFNDTFQTVIEGYAKDFAAKNNIKYESADGKEDSMAQLDQITAFINEGVNALVVVPVDPTAMQPVIDQAKAANIPLVFVNRTPFTAADGSDIPDGVYYVGSKSIDAGIFQAQYVVDKLGKDAKVGYAVLLGELSNEATTARTEGNKQGFKDCPNYTELAEQGGHWQRDQGLSITENWITAYGDKLNVILGNNDEMALGAVEALEQAGIKDKVMVLGVDLIDDAKVAIEAGRLDASVLQDGKGQGAGAMEVAMKAAKGEKPDKLTNVPFVLVTKDNLADYK